MRFNCLIFFHLRICVHDWLLLNQFEHNLWLENRGLNQVLICKLNISFLPTPWIVDRTLNVCEQRNCPKSVTTPNIVGRDQSIGVIRHNQTQIELLEPNELSLKSPAPVSQRKYWPKWFKLNVLLVWQLVCFT